MPQRHDDLAALRGSIPPLITPFTRGAVDYDRYARLVEFQIEQGSHGILVNGTTAEPSTLTTDERNRLVTLAVETAKRARARRRRHGLAVARRDAACSPSTRSTAGADSLLIVTPYYIRPPQRGLVAYYLELAAGHDVPWMVYHIPGRTAVGVTLDTLKAVQGRVAELRRHQAGRQRSRFRLGVPARVRPRLQSIRGARGAQLPDDDHRRLRPHERRRQSANRSVLAQMCEAVFATTWPTGQRLHEQLLEINKAVFYDTNPIPMKYMMKKLGLLADNEHRLPMMSATPELAAKLDGVLERAGL